MSKTNANRCWCGGWHLRSFTEKGRKHYSMRACAKANREEGLS